MCLSTVYMNSGSDRTQIMKDVTRLEAEGKGFWLVGLLGEKIFVEGCIQTVDLIDDHFILLEKSESI
jgi:predicted RNA-binding protein